MNLRGYNLWTWDNLQILRVPEMKTVPHKNSWAASAGILNGDFISKVDRLILTNDRPFVSLMVDQGLIWGTSIRWAFTMWNHKPSGNYLLIKDYGRFDRSLQIHGSIVITFHNIGLSVNHWILPISLGTSLYDRCPEKEGREGCTSDPLLVASPRDYNLPKDKTLSPTRPKRERKQECC